MVTLMANEMLKEHEVTIITYENPLAENREMYHLDERVNLEFVQGADYKDHKMTPARFLRSAAKVTNNLTGFFNRKIGVEFLKNMLYPRYVRKKWIDFFNARDFDFIVATASLSLLLAVIADEIKPKTAGWMHNCYEAYLNQRNKLFWKKNELLKVYFKKLDAVLVLTEYDRIDFDRQLGIRSFAMENPKSFVSEKKTDIRQKRFFVAARFVEQKGLDLLIRSFAKFCEVDQEWELIIAGNGPDRDKVLDLAWRKRVQSRIKFIGLTDKVEKYYLESSIYLLPSRWEGWGLVIIEAFEMGLPVIAFDIIPVDLLITNGIDGLIVEQFDTDKYAAAMVKLAKDIELRKSMSEKALEKTKQFTTERVYENWQKLFCTLGLK